MEITKNMVVTLTYELRTSGFTTEVIEKMNKKEPLSFIFGSGSMLDSFEAGLKGLKAGDKFKFIIKKDDGYGDYQEANIIDLPLDSFKINGKIDKDIMFVGNLIPLQDEDGNEYEAVIMEVGKTKVKLDFNHPLAGEDLYFKGEILEVRKATKEELSHGHVHGENGHQH